MQPKLDKLAKLFSGQTTLATSQNPLDKPYGILTKSGGRGDISSQPHEGYLYWLDAMMGLIQLTKHYQPLKVIRRGAFCVNNGDALKGSHWHDCKRHCKLQGGKSVICKVKPQEGQQNQHVSQSLQEMLSSRVLLNQDIYLSLWDFGFME